MWEQEENIVVGKTNAQFKRRKKLLGVIDLS